MWFFKVEAGSIRGIPDVMICAGGFFVAPELKVWPNKATPLQLRRIERINYAGGAAFELYPEDLDDFMDWLLEISTPPHLEDQEIEP